MSADMQTTTSDASTTASHPAGGDAAVVVENLTKRYGANTVVDQLSFTVQRGEIFALLGPNGAGKTTTIETLEGYRRPDVGNVRVLGLDPIREARALKPRIGVMLQQDGLYPGLTAREVVQLFAGYFRSPQHPDTLLDRLGLQHAKKTRYRRLSGGEKRRLALAVTLVGNPSLLFLDEPTTGMDPQARLATWEIIRELKRG
ncbi:MAG TPA: ABC transporter ATP-binding protein, partial [Ktedonobacteraceae bacterium]|nr:ABC transporter ATP-binding protein [Ktedonobacteraceae bacterium]